MSVPKVFDCQEFHELCMDYRGATFPDAQPAYEALQAYCSRAISEGTKWIAASERKPTATDLPIVFRQAGSRDHFCIDWPSELERVLNPRHENDRIIGLWFSLPEAPK